MYVARFVDFKRTRKGGISRPGGWGERRAFYIPLFDAINQRNELPTTAEGVRLRSARAKAFAPAERSRTPPDLPEQTAPNPVSRQHAHTSGVRKRLRFSLSIRSEVTPPLGSHLVLLSLWGPLPRVPTWFPDRRELRLVFRTFSVECGWPWASAESHG